MELYQKTLCRENSPCSHPRLQPCDFARAELREGEALLVPVVEHALNRRCLGLDEKVYLIVQFDNLCLVPENRRSILSSS